MHNKLGKTDAYILRKHFRNYLDDIRTNHISHRSSIEYIVNAMLLYTLYPSHRDRYPVIFIGENKGRIKITENIEVDNTLSVLKITLNI